MKHNKNVVVKRQNSMHTQINCKSKNSKEKHFPYKNSFDLESNIKLAENTLPGSIISLMKKEGHPLNISFICEKIKDRFLSFRKANGATHIAQRTIWNINVGIGLVDYMVKPQHDPLTGVDYPEIKLGLYKVIYIEKCSKKLEP